jgi:hypothetical protein
VIGSGELNAIDLAAAPPPTPAETVGSTGPDVQLVDADEFNDLDRKADDGAARVTDSTREQPPAHVDQAKVSWLRWIWSALGNTFAALATAVHQLIGLA